MKKVAIFVEGHTEAAFVRKLVIHVAGARGVNFISEVQHGGVFVQHYHDHSPGNDLEVLIANCCNDAAVLTFIRERYEKLAAAGYSSVLGLRDLYPLTHQELPALEAGMQTRVPDGDVPVQLVVAVAEVEAWFIEEVTHFTRIDPLLDDESVQVATGYSLSSRLAESLPHPAETLHQAYQVAGMAWRKTSSQVARTVSSLDFGFMLQDARKHSQSMDLFLCHLEEAFQ
ncbi:DUF4276 family protein [Sphingomonas desiccabilis]|uniref:DUF4276 family protein n=1 Tax=Sphingomonas desiccabilis TaxID=429134 RepID=A0A4Q2IXX6_9SPHN|nr:DUF4276 family protein [Sphingomonas desiccabilis]MBB3909534.1 hypothetical protein [Sphingomonas desiccabilis]RXZ34258.1 DUF4276 family protein [Sphingomonas desiccabilis]